jgi:hypothetical protein
MKWEILQDLFFPSVNSINFVILLEVENHPKNLHQKIERKKKT